MYEYEPQTNPAKARRFTYNRDYNTCITLKPLKKTDISKWPLQGKHKSK